jgi:hypothetical protein
MPNSARLVTGRNQIVTFVEANLVKGVVKPRLNERPQDVHLIMLSKQETKANGGLPKEPVRYPATVPDSFISAMAGCEVGTTFAVGDRIFTISWITQMTTEQVYVILGKLGYPVQPTASTQEEVTAVAAAASA